MSKIRALRPEEVEVRLSRTMKNDTRGAFLLYKTARTDAKILDETFGTEGWSNSFAEVKGRLFCTIEVKTEGGIVAKSDCGTESNVDAAKGEASDAFKRAGFKIGIGRELYSAPDIILPLKTKYDKWTVERIETDIEAEQIRRLQLYSPDHGRYVWNYGDNYFHEKKGDDPLQLDVSQEELDEAVERVKRLNAEGAKAGYRRDQIIRACRKTFGKAPEQLTDAEVDQAIEMMKTRSAQMKEAKDGKLLDQGERNADQA